MPPRPRYNKGGDEPPKPPDGEPSGEMLRWDVLSSIHSWRDDLDQDLIEDLCAAAGSMAYKKHVALACGVRPPLFEFWLNEGMRSDAPLLMQQLSCRFHMVQAFQSEQATRRISQAGARGDWNADAWLLSHRHPEWAQKKESSVADLGIETESAPPALSMKDRRAHSVAALKEAQRTGKGDLADIMRDAGLLPPKLPG